MSASGSGELRKNDVGGSRPSVIAFKRAAISSLIPPK
jgi:hypothetical protein